MCQTLCLVDSAATFPLDLVLTQESLNYLPNKQGLKLGPALLNKWATAWVPLVEIQTISVHQEESFLACLACPP